VVALAALAVAALLATQGCDVSPPAQASVAAHPDVTLAQARTIYQSYLSRSDAAAAKHDEVTALSLVADGAWDFTHAQFSIRAHNGTPVPRYTYGTPTFYVPVVSGYPHWFVVDVSRQTAAGSQAAGQAAGGSQAANPAASAPTLMVFGQVFAGHVWTLDASAAFQPGQSMPAVATDANGYAISMSPYQQGLLLQPNVLAGTHASIVDEGTDTAAGTLVAPGPMTTGLYQQQSAIYAATPKPLQYLWSMVGTTFPVFALRTTSGAALVLYGLDLDTTLEHPNGLVGAQIPIPAIDQLQFARPDEVADRGIAANWTYDFATIDPPASAGISHATVIAATGALSYADAY